MPAGEPGLSLRQGVPRVPGSPEEQLGGACPGRVLGLGPGVGCQDTDLALPRPEARALTFPAVGRGSSRRPVDSTPHPQAISRQMIRKQVPLCCSILCFLSF